MNEDIKKEILFMLYNYKNIEGLINKRKDELIETIDNGANSWSKSKTQINGHTMEHIIIKIDYLE